MENFLRHPIKIYADSYREVVRLALVQQLELFNSHQYYEYSHTLFHRQVKDPSMRRSIKEIEGDLQSCLPRFANRIQHIITIDHTLRELDQSLLHRNASRINIGARKLIKSNSFFLLTFQELLELDFAEDRSFEFDRIS